MTDLINQGEIMRSLGMAEVLEICERTFKDMGAGKTINPAKLGLDLGERESYPPYQGFMNAMPAYVGWLDVAGLKWAGGFGGERRRRGLPYLTSLILLLDPHSGEFLAVAEGAWITNLRTGAQTAVALKYLKEPGCGLRIGLFGAGMQARTQVAAIREWFRIESLKVYDVYPQAAAKFKEEVEPGLGCEVEVVAEPAEAAEGDTLICVTQSKAAFLRPEWVRPGTVVFPMGSYQEIENEVILGADHLVVDHVEQCLHRGALRELADTGRITASDIDVTIGELALGERRIESLAEKRIVCIPIGTGAMDVAVVKVLWDRLRKEKKLPAFDFTAGVG